MNSITLSAAQLDWYNRGIVLLMSIMRGRAEHGQAERTVYDDWRSEWELVEMPTGDAEGKFVNSLRPNFEDSDALRILLQREDMSDFSAEFLESLRNWQGAWTEQQLRYFDRICLDYFGAC